MTGNTAKLKELKERLEGFDQEDTRFQGILAMVYYALGENEKAERMMDHLSEIRLSAINKLTVRNYIKTVEIIQKNGSKFVSMQYPVRNIEPLKDMLRSNEDVIFIDNSKLFREAVVNEGYNEYFTDAFGGDFGHCTPKGNSLLADNIANIILKEVFDKY